MEMEMNWMVYPYELVQAQLSSGNEVFTCPNKKPVRQQVAIRMVKTFVGDCLFFLDERKFFRILVGG